MLNISHFNLIHIIFQGLILFLIGLLKDKTPKFLFYSLGFECILIPIFIGIPQLKLNYWNIIKIIHYILILPILLFISIKQKFSNSIYDNIMISGILIMIYHSFKLSKRLDLLFKA